MIHKNMFKMASVALSASLLFACSNTDLEETAEASSPAQEIVESAIDSVLTYTAGDEYEEIENAETIELSGTEADYASSAAVLFEEGTLTIKAGGTYVLSGSLDGQVVVDSEDDNPVRIVLDGVSIQSSETSAIFVEKAEKTIISLEEGSENRVADAANYSDTDDADEPNAAIFSKSDLTINGTGQLVVEGNYNNGIASKDSLKITGGELSIFAVDDALMGRDLVAVKDGSITIETGDDGIKTTNDEENTGTIALEGGTYSIVAGGDGIQSSADAYITGGDYAIASGGGSPDTVKTNSPGPAQGTTTEAEDEGAASTKGLKTEGDLSVTGGSFTVDSADDAVHSNGDVAISGGEWNLSTGEDGIHADQIMVLDAGTFDIAKSYEALEAAQLSINGGEYTLWASDDGINVSNGTATADEDTTTSTQEEPLLTITGGFMSVDAGGDGLDANGSIHMTGGTVLVNGPVTDMEGSIDYDNTFTQDGGLLIAAGSSGMVQSTSEDSAQAAVVMTFPDIQEAGTLTHLEDSAGNTVASFAPQKDYQAIYISSPDLQVGSSYTLSVGGSSTGEETEGLFTGGSYEGGTEVLSFVQEETATWLNEDGITEAAPEHAGAGGAGVGGDRQGGPPQGANPMEQLDEETALQVEEILAQLEAGTLTEEQAQAAMAELGIEVPMRPMDDTVPAQ